MAKLVDALGSGPSGGNTMEVRVLFWAHLKNSTPFVCVLVHQNLQIILSLSGPVEIIGIGVSSTEANRFK